MKKIINHDRGHFLRLLGLGIVVLSVVVWLGYSMPGNISLRLHPFGPKLLLLILFVLPLSLIIGRRYKIPRLWHKKLHLIGPAGLIYFACLMAAALGMLPVFISWGGAGIIDPSYSANYHVIDGHVPWSDAGSFLTAAHNLIFDGKLCEGCQRRAINAAFLAAKLAATGFDFDNAMLLQGVMFGLACLFCAVSVSRSSGVAAGVVTFAIVFSYGAYFLPTNMTETLGLTLGAAAFSVLWTGINYNRFYIYTLGLWLFCLSQIVRPGAVLIIPALAIVGMLKFPDKKVLFKLLVMVLLAISPGMFVDKLILLFYGDPSARSTAGNFSYLLYGITVGNKGWHQVFVDYPAIYAMSFAVAENFIYGKAIQNIVTHPWVFISGLWDAFKYGATNFLPDFRDHLTNGIGNKVRYSLLIPMVYVYLSGYGNSRRRKNTFDAKNGGKLFFAAVFIGFFASLAFIYKDGGIRSIAASVPFVAAIMAIGLFPRGIYNFSETRNQTMGSGYGPAYHVWGSGVLGVLVVLSALIGPAVAHMMVEPPPRVNINCAEGEQKKGLALLAIAYTEVPERESGHRVNESNEYVAYWNKVAAPASVFFAYDAIARTSFYGFGPPGLKEGGGEYLPVCASRLDAAFGMWKIQSVPSAK